MNDKELLKNISMLKSIQPTKEWVGLTKERIFGQAEQRVSPFAWVGQIGQSFSFFRKPAFVGAAFSFLLVGSIFVKIVSQSLPGDALYALKAKVESTQLSHLALAQKRLADLKAIAGQNNASKLPAAIKEFQATSNAVSKDFAMLVENQPKKALQARMEIVQLQRDKSQLEKTLGARLSTEEKNSDNDLENATKTLLKNEFSDLDSRTLTKEQLVLLNDAKNAYVKGDYETALEKVWTISN